MKLEYPHRFQLLTLSAAFVTLLAAAGCSDNPLVVNTEEVSVLKQGEQMEVLNRLDESIYYFAVEQGTLATILWAPISREENEIKGKSTKELSYSEVFGYEPGGTIILHYWTGDDPDSEDVRNVIIETGEQ